MRWVDRTLLALLLAALTALVGAIDARTVLPGAAASGTGAMSGVHDTGDLSRLADATAVHGPAVRGVASGAVRVVRHGGGHQASGAGGISALPAGGMLLGAAVGVEPVAVALLGVVAAARRAQPEGRAPPFASGI